MEEKQPSSTEVDQKNQLLPDNQAGTTSENRPISMDEFEGVEARWFPPGFRFKPSDGELILDYLNRKIRGEPLPLRDVFREVEFYKHDPEELTTATQHVPVNDGWYFFTQRERKGDNTFNRETGYGSWRTVDKRKKIVVGNDILIGYKRSLAYFSDGKKTEWSMKEYCSTLESQRPVNPQSDSKLTDAVICRVYRNPRTRGPRSNIPALNHPPPKRDRRKVKKKRPADAPQDVDPQAARPPHPATPMQQPAPCLDLCAQDHESFEPETKLEKLTMLDSSRDPTRPSKD